MQNISIKLKAFSAVMLVMGAVFFLSYLLNPWVFLILALTAYIVVMTEMVAFMLQIKEGLSND